MHRPIAIFDSGFGGLTVMKEVAKLLPFEDIIYLGDTAHLPYGNKSPQTIIQYALENSAFLLQKNVKLLVVACHTACSYALDLLQKQLPIPVIGVVDAGLHLLTVMPFSRIAILGTKSTIGSGIYQGRIQKHFPTAHINAVACPLFVPLIEEGMHLYPFAELIATEYLGSLTGQIDAALLACTHYPLMRPLLQKVLGPTVQLLEPALQCATETAQYLRDHNLLHPPQTKPHYSFFVSDDPQKFQTLGKTFFGSPIEIVEKK